MDQAAHGVAAEIGGEVADAQGPLRRRRRGRRARQHQGRHHFHHTGGMGGTHLAGQLQGQGQAQQPHRHRHRHRHRSLGFAGQFLADHRRQVGHVRVVVVPEAEPQPGTFHHRQQVEILGGPMAAAGGAAAWLVTGRWW
jgi:hypothetical protein